MSGKHYTYRFFRYGAIELLKSTAQGPVSIAFLQGVEAYDLYWALEDLESWAADVMISQYDYQEEAV